MPNLSQITHDGKTLTLTEWAKLTKIPASTIKSRLKAGKTVALALTLPVDKRFTRSGRPRNDAGARPCPELKERPTSGLAYCRWHANKKDNWKYFGPWGSAEAKRKYRRFALEWATGSAESGPASDTTIGRLVVLWLEHCERTYRKRGKPTSEVHCNRSAMRHMNKFYGDEPAAEFTPPKLRATREAMIEEDWTRKTVNDHCARILRAFGWAAGEGHVAITVQQALALVEPLAAGRRQDVAECEAVNSAL
jgi:hypothetical protein